MPRFKDMPLGQFVAMAASDAPTPGGGGVAALAGALGAAMASMAANFTAGRPKFAEHETAMRGALAGLAPIIERLAAAVDADAEAFLGISAAYAPSRADAEAKASRNAAIQAALAAAMRVPSAVLRDCAAAAALLPDLARRGNPNLLSDVEVAAIFLSASARAARTNVRVNADRLAGNEGACAMAEADALVAAAMGAAEEAIAIVAERTHPR